MSGEPIEMGPVPARAAAHHRGHGAETAAPVMSEGRLLSRAGCGHGRQD